MKGKADQRVGTFAISIEQAFGGIVAHDAADFWCRRGSRMSMVGKELDTKLLGHGRSLSLFHVDLEIDETGIEHFAHFGLREDFASEFLAGAAPTGVAVHEDLFTFLGGFGQRILSESCSKFTPSCFSSRSARNPSRLPASPGLRVAASRR